jgi:long-chain acyl-CoA synthetase
MKGYFRNPEATAKALRDGWLYTGDLAFQDTDGFLVVVGREKALLIAEEIEEAVTSSTDVVDQIMVFCDHRKYTAAFVTLDTAKVERRLKTMGIACAADLLAHLATELNRYRTDPWARKVQPAWAPSVFQVVAEPFSDKDGTLNSTMKIVRHRIAEVHRELVEYSYTKEGSKTGNPRNLEALRSLFKLP